MKPIKDTKVFQALKKFAPDVLDVVGDVFPPVDRLADLIKGKPDEAQKAIMQSFENDLRAFELEVADRESARRREIELGRFDFMQVFTGIFGLAAFGTVVYAVLFIDIPKENKNLFMHMQGVIEGIALSVFGYYFGSMISKNKR